MTSMTTMTPEEPDDRQPLTSSLEEISDAAGGYVVESDEGSPDGTEQPPND